MQDRKKTWAKLLSPDRLSAKPDEVHLLEGRTEFDRDYDRIVFSSAFRRMHDKTQVFPLTPSDHTRTRLTHSIEVSCVGRSLGQMAGTLLKKLEILDDKSLSPADVGTIVSAACLAHDIGNPPFGHSGEDAIRHWAEVQFKEGAETEIGKAITDAQQRLDFTAYEGNAQGFRIFAKLHGRERPGGLRLTYATIGAMMKYPHPSNVDRDIRLKDVGLKKFGFFQDDTDLAREAFEKLGLKRLAENTYARHPLAFLMEAADDICYAIIDLEDACHLKVTGYDEVKDLLRPIAQQVTGFREAASSDEMTNIAVLRAAAIHALTIACKEVFEENLETIEAGDFTQSLISGTKIKAEYMALKTMAQEKVYTDQQVLQVEYAGYQAIGGLLDIYASALVTNDKSRKAGNVRQLFPEHYLRLGSVEGTNRTELLERLSPYQRLLVVADYIAGMTDSFAIDLFQKLSGIKLPS